MDIVLGTISDEKNKLNKTVSNQQIYTGTLREETSIIKPSVVIEAENLSGYNYMYISEFGRYYFISDIVSVKNGLWRINGVVDVLMSFKSAIESSPIILSDTENVGYDEYVSGNAWFSTVKSKTDIINFPYGLNSTGEYILITSGG